MVDGPDQTEVEKGEKHQAELCGLRVASLIYNGEEIRFCGEGGQDLFVFSPHLYKGIENI